MTPDIETLIFTAYHGELTDAERDALSQWVTGAPANARLLIEYANESRGIEIALRSDQAAQADRAIEAMGHMFQVLDCDAMVDALDQTLAAGRSQEERDPADQSRGTGSLPGPLRPRGGWSGQAPGRGSRYVWAASVLLGVAALLGVAFWIGGDGPSRDRQDYTAVQTPAPAARLPQTGPESIESLPEVADTVDSDFMHFTNEDGDYRNQGGNLSVGFVAYTFWKRGVLVVAGPARWQMLKGDAVRLLDGMLVARADEDAYEPLSFLIDRTEIRVQGAEFGVCRTGPDTASIIVFAGSIEVSLSSPREQSSVQRIEAGQIGVLQTHLGTVEQQASATADDKVPFSPATSRMKYRPLETTRSAYYLHMIPQSLSIGDHRHPQFSDKACLSRELTGVIVAESDLAILERDPSNIVTLAAGQAVDSYILHFDPAVEAGQADASVEGMISFDRPILAVLGSSGALRATDARYGSPEAVYPRSSATTGGPEGSERWGIETANDSVELSQDRKTLFFSFHAGRDLDQVRILVEAK